MKNSESVEWVARFTEALRALRPHLSYRFASTIAEIHYKADLDPGDAALTYHQCQLDQLVHQASHREARHRG